MIQKDDVMSRARAEKQGGWQRKGGTPLPPPSRPPPRAPTWAQPQGCSSLPRQRPPPAAIVHSRFRFRFHRKWGLTSRDW